MGERKVVNTYIPADFDPSLVPRGKKLSSKDGTVPVRMMLPFSLQCDTCHTFLYRGRKFNSKKEAMGGPDGKYLGITRWRFYIKCTHCSRPVTFLTDPKNADYEMESGGVRNYEIQKDKAASEKEADEVHELEEKLDPMKALENRVLESQMEMADLDNLEEIKAMNARHVKILSGAVRKKGDNNILPSEAPPNSEGAVVDLLTTEDEALIQSIRFGSHRQQNEHSTTTIKRLDDDDEWQLEEQRKRDIAAIQDRQRTLEPPKSQMRLNIIKKRKRVVAQSSNGGMITEKNEAVEPKRHEQTTILPSTNNPTPKESPNEDNKAGGGLNALLVGYSSSDDST